MAPPTATETITETISHAPIIVPLVTQTQGTEAPAKVESPSEQPVEAAQAPSNDAPAHATSKPKVRRVIDEEGGTTTATV